jgi:uncharacterized protein (TIGR02186 family)
MMKRLSALLFLLAAGLWPWAPIAQALTSVEAHMEPNVVSIGAFFNGARITVKGKVPASSEAMITVTGQEENLELNRKGRAFGLLWMNVGTMTFHQVPSVYLLYTSEPLETSTQTHLHEGRQTAGGFEALEKKASITPACGEEAGALFNEFLKLKKQEGLYALHGGEIRYGQEKNKEKSYEATLRIPAKIPPGRYDVTVSAVNGGSVVGTASENLMVKAVGMPAYLSSFSLHHGLLYGVLAVLTAVCTGLLMDTLFGSKRPHSH